MPKWITEDPVASIGVASAILFSLIAIAVSLRTRAEARREAREGPARQRQHERLDIVTANLAELKTALTDADRAVVLPDESARVKSATEIHDAAGVVEKAVTTISEQNLPELATLIKSLRQATVERPSGIESLVERMYHAALNIQALEIAHESIRMGHTEVHDLRGFAQAVRNQTDDHRRLRDQTYKALVAAERVGDRVRELDTKGFRRLSTGGTRRTGPISQIRGWVRRGTSR